MLKLTNPRAKKEHVFKFYNNEKEYGSFHIVNKPSCKEVWCFGIYDPQDRGVGLGQQMLKECLEMLSGNIVELGCLKDNYRALHIYHKFGFVIVKDCGEYYWMRREVE